MIFVGIILSRKAHNSRSIREGIFSWYNLLIKTEFYTIDYPLLILHPPIIEINNVWMRTIVCLQEIGCAFTFCKVLIKL